VAVDFMENPSLFPAKTQLILADRPCGTQKSPFNLKIFNKAPYIAIITYCFLLILAIGYEFTYCL
jgi:hypothetical protein